MLSNKGGTVLSAVGFGFMGNIESTVADVAVGALMFQ